LSNRLVVRQGFDLLVFDLVARAAEELFDKKCARRDCSRLRRSSSASLRTAAAPCAATSNPARRRVVEPSCCLSAVRTACSMPAGLGCRKIFMGKVRPDGFEPPTPWFEAFRTVKIAKLEFGQL